MSDSDGGAGDGDLELQNVARNEGEVEDEEEGGEEQIVVEAVGDDDAAASNDGDGAGGGDEVADAPAQSANVRVVILLVIVVALAAAVIALAIAIAVDDRDNVVAPSSTPRGVTQPPVAPPLDGSVEMVQGEGLAKVPVAIADFLKELVALPPGADGLRQLALPPDMLEGLNGKCAFLEQYTESENTAYWQCAQSSNNPSFPLPEDFNRGVPYQPTDAVLTLMANATGTSLSSLENMNISSGQPNAPLGAWCGMPVAGWEHFDTFTQQERIAYEYWLTCVSPRAGFMNVLQCEGDCSTEDGDDCSTYAVLGYAALEANVCYPAHQHTAQEAYWQVAGRGWWRTWTNVSHLDDFQYASYDNFGGSRYALHPHRSGIPHEFDTTGDLDNDGGAGTLEIPMVMIYWWGKQNNIPNNYRWASGVRDGDTYRYQDSAQTCGNARRIPVYNDRPGTQNITAQNC